MRQRSNSMALTIIDALADRKLFGALFKGDLATWFAWLVWLKAVFGLPMETAELELFEKCTGRSRPPINGAKEVYSIVGRRGGKSRIAATVAVFVACFISFAQYLVAGERGMVLILARDRDQAKVVFNYIGGILKAVPVLRQMVVAWRADEIELNNSIVIAVKTSDYRSVRGVTVVCAVADEAAFWDSQGVNPDKEIFQALRPAMATVFEAKLLVISTGYSQSGVLFDMHKEFYGRDDDEILIWQADSRTMNPTLSESMIQRELEKDPESARAEWLGLFRSDISAAFSLELIESCIIPGRVELLPSRELGPYLAFCDPSGGRHDAFTLAVAHLHPTDDMLFIDAIRRRNPPFDPDEVVKEYSELLKLYGLSSVTGDDYGAELVVSAFGKNGISYQSSQWTRSELYLNLIPVLSSKKVQLLDNMQLKNELRRLERRTSRSGKDVIDHGPHARDDVANVCAGVVSLARHGVTFDAEQFVKMNSYTPERTVHADRSWLDQGATSDLHPMDRLIDQSRRGGRRGFWDL
jgi:terminase large subunit-like protein